MPAVVFWTGFLTVLSVGLIWGSERYLAEELQKPTMVSAPAEVRTGTLVLAPLRYYALVLENSNREDPFELGKKLAADGFAVVTAGDPSNQVMVGVAREAENLTDLRETLRSGGWQSRVEEMGVPRTELAYSLEDAFFVQGLGPFLIRIHRWAGRLIDFANDPWSQIQSTPEAKERLAILAREFASCDEEAKRILDSAPLKEKALIGELLAGMDRVGQGIASLEDDGSMGSHGYLTQQISAFLCRWEDVIFSCENLS
jgi:hypothetical protein